MKTKQTHTHLAHGDHGTSHIEQTHAANCGEYELSCDEFELHPLAHLPPPMPEARYRELVASIKLHSQLVAVTTLDGKILDGRHRAQACKELGIGVRAKRLAPGIDPLGYVIAQNLRRRQLSAGQRAAFAAKLMPFYAAEAAKRKQALSGTRANPSGSKPEVTEILPEPDACGEAREKAALATGASARYVSDALKLQRNASELFKAVDSGTMSIPKALRELGAQRTEGTTPGQNNLLIVLRDDSNAPSSRAPEKRFGAKTYPSLMVFHLHDAGDIKVESAAKGGCAHVALFVVPVESDLTTKDADGKSFCKPSCRFLSLSVRGSVPEPAIVPDQIIHGGYMGVISMIESMYPDAHKTVNTVDEKAPSGWDHLPQESRATGSVKARNVATVSPQPTVPSDVPNPPSGPVRSTMAVNKTPDQIVKSQTKRKTKATTVRDHLSKLRDAFESIQADLSRSLDNASETVRRLKRYAARRDTLSKLDAVTKQLAQIVVSLGTVGNLPFSTRIVPRGLRFKRVKRMVEIMVAVAKVIQDAAPKITQELQAVVAELDCIRSRGGL